MIKLAEQLAGFGVPRTESIHQGWRQVGQGMAGSLWFGHFWIHSPRLFYETSPIYYNSARGISTDSFLEIIPLIAPMR